MEAWKCIATGMMSEEETTGDGKIERRRPSWRSERINNWMDELDRRGTDTWKVARKERIGGPLLQLQAPAGLNAWMVKS